MYFEQSERINKWQLQVSPRKEDQKVYVNQDVYVSRTTLQAGKEISYTKYRPESAVYLILISGSTSLADFTFSAKDAL